MSQHSTSQADAADTGPVAFGPRAMAEYKEILARYPERRAALMPVLWLVQREFGWVSPSAQTYVAELMELPQAWVEGVGSFYTMYWRRPMGRSQRKGLSDERRRPVRLGHPRRQVVHRDLHGAQSRGDAAVDRAQGQRAHPESRGRESREHPRHPPDQRRVREHAHRRPDEAFH